MKTIRRFIRRYPALTYFVLACAISWGGIFIATGPGGMGRMDEVSDALLPLIYLAMLAGPSVAGLLLTGVVDGRAGYRALGRRLGRWRVSLRWYAAALLAAPLSIAAALLLLGPSAQAYVPALLTTGDTRALLLSSVAAGLLVGLFEEIGWTGFAVPHLRRDHGMVVTGLLVGVVWGAWHFVTFWESDTFTGALPVTLLLVRLFAWLPAYRVLMVWVYDRTHSLPVVILMHGSLVAGQFILAPGDLADATLVTWLLVWAAVLWAMAAAAGVTGSSRPTRVRLPGELHGASR